MYREYEITEIELDELSIASQFDHVTVTPKMAAERATDIWMRLAKKYRFVWYTVSKAPGKPERIFLAQEDLS